MKRLPLSPASIPQPINPAHPTTSPNERRPALMPSTAKPALVLSPGNQSSIRAYNPGGAPQRLGTLPVGVDWRSAREGRGTVVHMLCIPCASGV